MAFAKLQRCFSEPKYIVRLIAIIICLSIAIFQLQGCFYKILHPPISTHYTFKLNQTVKYPSITLCRNPPYKTETFKKYGLTMASQPFYSSSWKEFNFDNYTLDQFFKEATYSLMEVIPFKGFAGYTDNIEIKEFLKLQHGRCFKLSAKNSTTPWSYHTGFLLYMLHTDTKHDIYDGFIPGYHIHIHEPTEMITESHHQSDSFMEYIYVEIGEDVKYSLRTNEYSQLPNKDNNCTEQLDYSRSKCKEMCLHKLVTEEVGCSAPWIENDNLPRCNSYESTRALIKAYNNYSEPEYDYLCKCPRSCNITIYIPYVQSQKEIELPTSVLSLYYTSNLVTVMEEISGYDWNLFIADLGGSLGFLLGLSLLGIIGVTEQLLEACIGSKKKKKIADPVSARNIEIFVNGVKVDENYDYNEHGEKIIDSKELKH